MAGVAAKSMMQAVARRNMRIAFPPFFSKGKGQSSTGMVLEGGQAKKISETG